jgi:hypothetical protein
MKLNPLMLVLGLWALGSWKKSPSPAAPSLRIPKNGTPFTIEQLRELAAQIGFPDPNTAAAVAMAESSGFADAVGDSGHSLGLWQINIPAHPEYDAAQLFDPTYNGTAALAISQTAKGWNHWTMFTNGKYARYMPAPGVDGERPAAQLEAADPPPAADAHAQAHAERVDEPAGAPLVVEVLERDDDQEHEQANGVDAHVRISEAAPAKRDGGRRARR